MTERPYRKTLTDHERFDRLFQNTSQDLLAFLLRRCPSIEDASDCLAEAFRIAWEKRDQIPAGEEARPWLFGVARNVNHRSKQHDERAALATQELTRATQQATARPTQDNRTIAALATLTPLDREIIKMLAWDELPPREIAAILGLSSNVVRVRAHRARQHLRELLTNHEHPESKAMRNAEVHDS